MHERRRGLGHEIVFKDKQLVVSRTVVPDGLRLVGAVDASNVEGLQGVLDDELGNNGTGRVIHIDLTRLEFSDVSGIRTLVGVAERGSGRYRIVLHGLPPLIGRVIDVVGWSEMPSLEVSPDGFPGMDRAG